MHNTFDLWSSNVCMLILENLTIPMYVCFRMKSGYSTQQENIAQVYNFTSLTMKFMVMEYVPGVDLENYKRLASQNKGIPIRITLKILYDILQALIMPTIGDTFGQSLIIVHRDVNLKCDAQHSWRSQTHRLWCCQS